MSNLADPYCYGGAVTVDFSQTNFVYIVRMLNIFIGDQKEKKKRDAFEDSSLIVRTIVFGR